MRFIFGNIGPTIRKSWSEIGEHYNEGLLKLYIKGYGIRDKIFAAICLSMWEIV